MSWKLRIDYIRYQDPAFAGGAAENRPAAVLASQTLAGSGATQVTGDPGPAFDGGLGYARLTVLAGAVIIGWGATPAPAEAGGLRLEAGQSESVGLQSAQRIGVVEAADGPVLGASQAYALLANASATGPTVSGLGAGSYVWTVQGAFGGATVALQALGPDGATWLTIASKTAPDTGAATGVVVGANATMRATVAGGSPSALFSTLS